MLVSLVGNYFPEAANERSDKEGAGEHSSPAPCLDTSGSAHRQRQVGMAEWVLFILRVVAITRMLRNVVTTRNLVVRCVGSIACREPLLMETGLRSSQVSSVGRRQNHPFAIRRKTDARPRH